MRAVPQGRDGHLVSLEDDPTEEPPPPSTGILRHTWVDLDLGTTHVRVIEWPHAATEDSIEVQAPSYVLDVRIPPYHQQVVLTPAEMQRLYEQLRHLARAKAW
jgi:hypothetical protein